ncbi:hypothetical protein TKK_0013581 [Trichogramma kaykai]
MTNYYANGETTRKVATSNVYHDRDRLRNSSSSSSSSSHKPQHKPESMSNTMRAMQQHPRASTKLRSVTIDIEPMLHQQQSQPQRRHLYEPNLAYAAGMDEILQRDQRTCHTNKSAAEMVPRAGSDAQKQQQQQQQQPRWQQQYNNNNNNNSNNNYKSDSLHGAVISSMYNNNVKKCSSSSSSSSNSGGAVLDKEESDRVAVATRSHKSHIISLSCSNSHNNHSGSKNVGNSPKASQRLLDSSSSANETVACPADQQPMIASQQQQQQQQQSRNSQCKMQRGLVLNARTYNDEMLKQQRKSQYDPCEKRSDDHVSYTSVDLSDGRTTSTSSSASSTESTTGSTTDSQEGLSRLRKAKCAFGCRTWLSLGSLLVALFAVTVGQGAPLAMMSQEAREARRLVSVAKWKNPCGFAAEELADDDVEVVQLDDATLLGNIVMQAKTALNYAQNVRDDYIKRTFGTDFKDLHLTWKDNHYDWLPGLAQIPKQLGEPLGLDYLDKLDLDNALLNVYEYLQRYAVGLEQVAWDQQDNALAFQQEFKDMENHLRSVLCEVQMALAERNVPQREDIDRDIMPEEYRNMWTSATYRNLRDWLIYRDYMNGLEYIVEVFDHLISQIQRTSV